MSSTMDPKTKAKEMTPRQLGRLAYQTCTWWNALFVQMDRCTQAMEKREFNWPFDGSSTADSTMITADRLFLIHAIYHAVEGIEKLDIELRRRDDPSFQPVLEAICSNAALEDIKDLRNMNEHNLSYLVGTGHAQERFASTVRAGNHTIRTNAFWSVIIGSTDTFLCGNVHIMKLLDAMKAQLPLVRRKTEEIFLQATKDA